MANWAWTALFGGLLIVDWALGSWLIKFRALSSPPTRWSRARMAELAVAFVFAGIALAQLLGLRG
jgi:hypothetical protein